MTRAQLIAELGTLRRDFDQRLGKILAELERDVPKREPPATTDPDPSAPRPFRGRFMESKFAGRCVVCGESFAVGDRIVYNGDLRKSAHFGCGQADTRSNA